MIETFFIVDGGGLFFGTRAHWQDCFFDNASDENIKDFCRSRGYHLRIVKVLKMAKVCDNPSIDRNLFNRWAILPFTLTVDKATTEDVG